MIVLTSSLTFFVLNINQLRVFRNEIFLSFYSFWEKPSFLIDSVYNFYRHIKSVQLYYYH